MKSFRDFINGFLKNKGQYVFLSLLIAKICAFASSVLIIRILPQSEFGQISIVASVFAIFVPFNGFGSTQSLLRFGSITENETEKQQLSAYLLRKGFLNHLLLSLLFLGTSIFYVQKYQDLFLLFICFAIRLVGIFFLAHIQVELRINGKNREFAKVGNVVNIASLVLVLILSYFLGVKGYLIAIMVSPFFALYWLNFKNIPKIKTPFQWTKKEIWNYAFHSAGTNSLSEALAAIDVILLSFFMNETAVANYKAAILIPANITFLAATFMQTDFPTIAKNYKNKSYLINYIKNYYKLFIPICLIIFLVGSFWSSFILKLFFGERYHDNSLIFIFLLAAFCLNMLFRNLYGNLNSAVGKMNFNTIVSVLALLILAGLSFLLVPSHGIVGMAIAVGITLFSSGIILALYFHSYIKSLN